MMTLAIPTGLTPAETQRTVDKIARMRQQARDHPEASMPSRALGRFRACERCGAMRPDDRAVTQCAVCGEFDSPELLRVVFGRSHPYALRRIVRTWLLCAVVAGAIGVALVLTRHGIGIALGCAALAIAAWFLVQAFRAASMRRLYLDRFWVLWTGRIDVVTFPGCNVVTWEQVDEIAVGARVDDWTELRLEGIRAGDAPRDIWIDSRHEEAESIVAVVRDAIRADRARAGGEVARAGRQDRECEDHPSHGANDVSQCVPSEDQPRG